MQIEKIASLFQNTHKFTAIIAYLLVRLSAALSPYYVYEHKRASLRLHQHQRQIRCVENGARGGNFLNVSGRRVCVCVGPAFIVAGEEKRRPRNATHFARADAIISPRISS